MSVYSWSYAPTNRATCKGSCKEKIDKGAIRLGVSSDESHMGYSMTSFRCLKCVTAIQVKNMIAKCGSLEDVDGYQALEEVDQGLVSALADGTGGAAKAKAKGKGKAKAAPPPAAPKRGAKAKAKPEAKAKGRAKAKAAPKVPPGAVQHAFLDKAKQYDFDKVKEMLEEWPGLINVQPNGRWSALHQFAAAGNEEAVRFLLKKGADQSAKNKDGQTAEDVAHEDVVNIFEEDFAEEEEEEAAPEEEVAPEPEPPAPTKRKAPEAPAASSSAAPMAKAPETKPEPSPKKKAKGAGGRPVDGDVPNRDDYSVVDDWSVLLNQTNVVANNNKYYKIQVLKHKDGKYYCWTHWGRVGTSGQNQLQLLGTQAAAESAFKSKFKSKSGVAYECLHTHDWTPVVGKYTFVETEEGGDGEGEEGAPLGKLTPQQIEKGQTVLAKIGDVMGRAGKVDTGKIAAFSSQFYTLIPHDFGFKVPPPINTPEMLEAEEELLKFYLRMGFEEMDQADDGLSPVDGIMELALPPTLETAASKLCAMKDIKASTDRGRTHAKKQSGGPAKKMEEHLYAAIMLYTSNAIYRDLNKVLRSEDRTKIKKYFLYLRLLLEALGRLPQQVKTLWRGIGVDLYDQYQVGQTITWWGVSSCTADIKVAKNFMNGCGGKCTLLTVKTMTAADISDITFFGNEKENLLAPGTQLKVVSSKREGKVTEIQLEEVGRALH
uniref:NAD(P)(+)--arginine ADP-ribosyltransferase n=1 Tax=Crypthecodinium cohnii TaxID=2866 RepID=A0A516AGS9_CRYCO|nr:poly [ADP-ribose] polymerase 2 [Crypthecodinium cohnii]USW07837.1 poly [ADP-ribose] polymerase 2 [Crypthecodinium cohnii]